MLVASTGLVRGEGLAPADLARNGERSDAPARLESPRCLRSARVLARSPAASCAGPGESRRTLRFPGSPEALARYDDHRDARHRADERTCGACTIGHMF